MHNTPSILSRRLPQTPESASKGSDKPSAERRYARNAVTSYTPPSGTPQMIGRRLQHAISSDENGIAYAMRECQITTPLSGRSQSVFLTVTPDPRNFASVSDNNQSAQCKRTNFQRSCQNSMGQRESTPSDCRTPQYGFSSSFDASTVAMNSLRASSTAASAAGSSRESLTQDMELRHAVSSGALHAPTARYKTYNGPNIMPTMRSERSSSATARKTSARNATSPLKIKAKQPPVAALSTLCQKVVMFCFENARGDVAGRVLSRTAHKRDDFGHYCANLSNEQCLDFITSFREYLNGVVKNLHSSENIRALSMEFGASQVFRRSMGFKADFFAGMAEALTTEGTFLDGATHQPTEAIEAWSELVGLMFSNIRDGYYQQVRYMRRSSHCFHGNYNHSSDLSTDGSELSLIEAHPLSTASARY
jgi:hypothetical protein